MRVLRAGTRSTPVTPLWIAGEGTILVRPGSSDVRRGDEMENVLEGIEKEIKKVVVGQDDIVELALAAVCTGGHLLIEGVPGIAKTTLANAIARTMAVKFKRVQFTPDTEPSDLTGRLGPGQLGTTFHPGPVFTNVLLADEINRTPPHTQAALLEAMQERQVSVAGETYKLPEPFLVIATQNPVDQEGTFRLPESQLDRFLFKADMSYPARADEIEVLRVPHEGVTATALNQVSTVVTAADLIEARRDVDRTLVAAEMLEYIVEIVRRTRVHPRVVLGASTRAAVHLLAASKALARMRDQDEVSPRDVAKAALPVLRHRLILVPGAGTDRETADDVVRAVLDEVPAPHSS